MRRSLPPLFLTKSPLVVVLGQIKFTPVLAMEKYVPKIQDALRRKKYPRFREETVSEITWNLPQNSSTGSPSFEQRERKQWEFADPDLTWSIKLGSDFITMMTSAYETYEVFEDRFAEALSSVHEEAALGLTVRMGLRYIDLVQPERGLDFADYLDERMLGLPADEIGFTESFPFMQMRGPTHLGFMVVRCVFLNTGDVLPPDLSGINLRQRKKARQGEKVAVLDLDHFREDEAAFDPSDSLERLSDLHDDLDRAFRAATTKRALELWGHRNEKRKEKEPVMKSGKGNRR